jgi:hypothetical protein
MDGLTEWARRVCRALDLGIYEDVADAQAHEGGNLTDAEWADVREWWGCRTFGSAADVPF